MSLTEYKREGPRRLTLEALKCQDCGTVTSLLSRSICLHCHGVNLERTSLAGAGVVNTLTTVHYPPAEFEGLEPYEIVMVAMAGGGKVIAPALRRGGVKVGLGEAVEPTLRRIKTSTQEGTIYYGVKFRATRAGT